MAILNANLLGHIIQIHLDAVDPDSFLVGRLCWVDRTWFLMQDISSLGKWNGLVLYRQEDVISIEENTAYIEKLKKLIDLRGDTAPNIPDLLDSPLSKFLLYAQTQNTVLGLELCASGYRDVDGYVCSLANNILCVEQLDEFGRDDGRSYILLDSITRCYIGDNDSECLLLLSPRKAENS